LGNLRKKKKKKREKKGNKKERKIEKCKKQSGAKFGALSFL
jgi:hypothetical protein